MKNIIATAIALTIATSASASWDNNNVTKWGGSTSANQFPDGCKFKDQDSGTMTLTDDKWTVQTPATIRIKSRNIGNMIIKTDNKLYEGNATNSTAPVTVSYSGSTVDFIKGSGQVNLQNSGQINIGSISGNGNRKMLITLKGSAQMATDAADDLLDNSKNYEIRHTVTCTQ